MSIVSRVSYYRRNREKLLKRNKEYRETHVDEVRAAEAKSQEMKRKRGTTCEILQHHADEHQDDPERLTTEFMKQLIGCECD